jgi:hypothetical protein
MYSLLLVSTLIVSPTCEHTIMVKRMCCSSGSTISTIWKVLCCIKAFAQKAGVVA